MSNPRAPGWHPDPDDPASLRHWDGRRWGGERRPRPTWASGPPPRVRRSGRRRRRWLVAAGVGAVALAVVSAVISGLGRGGDVGPRTVTDRAFTRQANRVCARTLPALRRERPRGRQAGRSGSAVADQVDGVADRLELMVAELRAIPVAPVDQLQVDRWLGDWQDYVGVGRRYADSLREGDEEASTEVTGEGDRLGRHIFRFAMANGMPECTP